jgi:hypothetical protein
MSAARYSKDGKRLTLISVTSTGFTVKLLYLPCYSKSIMITKGQVGLAAIFVVTTLASGVLSTVISICGCTNENLRKILRISSFYRINYYPSFRYVGATQENFC